MSSRKEETEETIVEEVPQNASQCQTSSTEIYQTSSLEFTPLSQARTIADTNFLACMGWEMDLPQRGNIEAHWAKLVRGVWGGHAFPGKFLNRLLQRCDFLHAGCSLKCQLSLTLLCPLWVRGKRRMTFQTMLGEQWLYLNHRGYSPLWQCCEKDHSSRPKLWDIFWSGYVAMQWERRFFLWSHIKEQGMRGRVVLLTA